MTHFLVSEEKQDGFKLEDILKILRKDIFLRCGKILDDVRPEAQHVLRNNTKILELLGEAIALAEDSTQTLDRSFGPSQAGKGGLPRIGTP